MASIRHKKTNEIPDWTQEQLNFLIGQGQYPVGTTLEDIVLPSDWNNEHDIDISGLVTAGDNIEITGAGTEGDPLIINSTGSGSGDVVGPASSVDGNVTIFDGTTGKLIADSGIASANIVQVGDNISDLTNDAGYITNLSGFTTDDLTEGSINLYDKTVSITGDSDIGVSGTYPNFTLSFDNGSGYITDLSGFTTDDLADTATNRYTNDTDIARLANTSGTNTGDVTVTDSSEIDFTLTGQNITASIIAGSIDESKLDASVNASLDLADSALQPGDDVSEMVNDAGYLTSSDLSGYVPYTGATNDVDLGVYGIDANNLLISTDYTSGSIMSITRDGEGEVWRIVPSGDSVVMEFSETGGTDTFASFGYVSGNFFEMSEGLRIASGKRLTMGGTGEYITSTGGSFSFYAGNTLTLQLDNTGNNGFGTPSPATKLHVVNTVEQFRVGYDSSNYLSTTVGSSGSVTFNLTGTSPEFTFSDAVNVPDEAYGSGWNGNTEVPTKNAVYDKVETLQPLDATLTGLAGLSISAGKLIRATGTDTFDTINYTTGSWTPILSGSSVAGTPTYVAQGGRYWEIGDMVIVVCNIAISAKTSVSGTIRIGGLPFAVNATSTTRSGISSGSSSGYTLAAGVLSGYADPGQTYVTLQILGLTGHTDFTDTQLGASFVARFSLIYQRG